MGKTTSRSGISPVVSTVLLLMMAVGAAGGVYAWSQGIIGGQQGDAEQDLDTELTVRDIQCQSGGASPELDFFLDNTGSTTVDGSDVTIYLYSVSSGSLEDTASASPGDIAPGSDWEGTTDFSNADMTNGEEYRVEFEFTNQDSYMVSATCQAS